VEPTVGLSDLGLELLRDGLLYVPESYSPDTPAPLFIGLHGAGGAASNWESYPDRAEARGMIFLAPDSRFSTWDVIRGKYALSLGLVNGDLFSHLVAYSPGFYVNADPPVGKPRVYVSHGAWDNVLPVTTSRNMIVPTLSSTDYDVTYEEFDGGHEVPAAISESALDWFLA
jgi:predicted esterase